MKKVSSQVWQFFDRLEENKRCVAVLCKLCETEYKYFGNTTNLRAHLIKKHPLQWEFRQNSLEGRKLDDQPITRIYEEDEIGNISSTEVPAKRRKRVRAEVDQTADEMDQSETENDHVDAEDDIATLNLVRQMHDSHGSDEEWLEEDYVYEPTHKKTYRKVKREIITPPRKVSYVPSSSMKPKKVRTERLIINNSQNDEFSVFGEYIANKIRKFKSPRTRGNIQQIITTILWQAEYGSYDDAEAVKRVLRSSMQYDVEQQSAVHDDIPIPSQNYTEKLIEDTVGNADTENLQRLGYVA